MSLPRDYLAALEILGRVFVAYRAKTGHSAVLVGGAATAIYTDGAFMSGDFDVVARRFRVAPMSTVELPAIEDLIADRLGQYAVAVHADKSRLNQARTLPNWQMRWTCPIIEAYRGGRRGCVSSRDRVRRARKFMKTTDLRTYLARGAKRKAALGIVDDEQGTESLRNSGANRTEEKRELLRRIEARSKAAGRTGVVSRF
jgi:hypothetical protein